MSAVATPTTTHAPRPDRGPLGLLRLARIEARKSVDTRAGAWLLIAVVGLTLLVAVAVALAAEDPSLGDVLSGAAQPAAILLPVVGILAMTSEWSQRTALQTFTLVPRRGRVLLAKLLATTAVGVAAWVLVVVAGLGLGALLGADGPLDGGVAVVLQVGLYVVTGMLTGLGFGMLFGSSPVAIVLYFVLPTVWGALTSLISGLDGLGAWLDTSRTLAPLADRTLDGTDWAQVATSLAVWMVLPLAVGALRVMRREVS